MTDSGERKSFTVTLMPSSRSSRCKPTIMGTLTTRVTVVRRVSSSAAEAHRGPGPRATTSRASANVRRSMVMSAPRRRRERLGGRAGRRHDVLVAGAAAQVAGDRLADLRLRRMGTFAQETGEGHQEARRAEPALQAMIFPECFLERAQGVTLGQPFHGLDHAAVHLDGEEQARADGGAVDDDGAGAAHAVLAPEMRARQIEVVAQEVRQRPPHLYRPFVGTPVDGDADRALVHRGSAARPPTARSVASTSVRRARTPARCFLYSREAWRSLSGRTNADTRRPTSSNAASVGFAPTSARVASRGITGVGPTPVNANAAVVQTPASSRPTVAATPTSAKSP